MYAAAKEDTKEMDYFVKVNSLMHIRYVEDPTLCHDAIPILTTLL